MIIDEFFNLSKELRNTLKMTSRFRQTAEGINRLNEIIPLFLLVCL